ncbi:SOS response-associated peptidase [Myxococcota bacterium]|nr:SOS response-associated peptidase [Myxococcota bacterium]
MCGRFTLSVPPDVLARLFGLDAVPTTLGPRYNIAPTQPVAIIRRAPGPDGRRVVELARWGLVPEHAKDAKGGAKLINARQETLFDKAVFRDAARWRRCLVPADAFFEWRAPEPGAPSKKKQPYKIGLASGAPFAMAGIHERWTPPDGGPPIETVSVVTTSANALVMPIHDRMPVILRDDEDELALWLDPKITARAPLERVLRPLEPERMVIVPVSTRVSDVNNDDPDCVRPIDLDARDVHAAPDATPTASEVRDAPRAKRQLGFDF